MSNGLGEGSGSAARHWIGADVGSVHGLAEDTLRAFGGQRAGVGHG